MIQKNTLYNSKRLSRMMSCLTLFIFLFSIPLLYSVDICEQCDPASPVVYFASSSQTGRIWYDLTSVFGLGNRYMILSNNPFGRIDNPYIIFYAVYSAEQSFNMEKYAETGWCNSSENQGHRASMSITGFSLPSQQDALTAALNSDQVDADFRQNLDGPYVYRIKIVAPDSGYGSGLLLTATANANYCCGLGWVVHYKKTIDRIRMCSQIGSIPMCYYGPEDQPLLFTRKSGKPQSQEIQWTSCGGPGEIIISSDNISSAQIILNGEVIVYPNDFKNKVTSIILNTELFEGDNEMTVELRGKPGDQLKIEFLRNQ